MNFLGHPYVAFKSVGRLMPLLVAGSHLPDLVPFVPDSVFTFEEIHESPDKFLRFLEQKHPDKKDLALGMMTHSVKFGADKYNREIENWLLKDNPKLKQQLVEEIVNCSGVSRETAEKGRLHNCLWMGVDVYLLKTEKRFVKRLAETYPQINREEIAELLSQCFNKDFVEVKTIVDKMFGPLVEAPILSLSDLARIWKTALAGLPEKDDVDEAKALLLFEEIYERFKEKWPGILSRVIKDTKKSLKPFV